VYYVPDVAANLISVHKLRQCGYSIEIAPDAFKIIDTNNNLAAIATGVYQINTLKRTIYTVTNPDPLYLWHLRLGHAHYELVSKMTEIPIKANTRLSAF
jgi:hypothetical protein